jgi:glyoxylase-like metal-dependent hydrolase (beta-lactamase superfamily II)
MELVEVAPNVRRVAAREGPGRHAHSHAYVLDLGDGRTLAIDAGHDREDETAWWVARVDVLGLTHHHLDHTHLVEEVQRRTGCELWAPPRGEPTRYTPHQQYEITRELCEGDVIGRWTVLELPGHTHHQIGFHDGHTLVCGDALKINPENDGDAAAFVRTVEWMIALAPRVVLASHMQPIRAHFAEWATWRLNEIREGGP